MRERYKCSPRKFHQSFALWPRNSWSSFASLQLFGGTRKTYPAVSRTYATTTLSTVPRDATRASWRRGRSGTKRQNRRGTKCYQVVTQRGTSKAKSSLINKMTIVSIIHFSSSILSYTFIFHTFLSFSTMWITSEYTVCKLVLRFEIWDQDLRFMSCENF